VLAISFGAFTLLIWDKKGNQSLKNLVPFISKGSVLESQNSQRINSGVVDS